MAATAIRSILALVLREVSATDGRAGLGFLWAVAEPVLGIALLCAAFAVFFDQPPLGRDFALFYATGILPFLFVFDTSNRVAQAVRYSRPMLLFPRVSATDAVLARWLLNGLVHLVIWGLVLGGIAVVRPVPPFPLLALAVPLGLAALLAFGVGCFSCALGSFWPAWPRIWSVVAKPLFLVSGVFFLPDGLASGVRDLILWNPVSHVVMMVRAAVYAGYDGDLAQPLFVLTVALGLSVLGLIWLPAAARAVLQEAA